MSRRIHLLVVYLAAAAALLFVPLPIPATFAGRTIENAGHGPLFLIGTLFILSILKHELRLEGARLYLWAGLVGTGAGFLSEVIQKPLRRDASWEDVLADTIGVMCALALHAACRPRGQVRPPVRAIAALVAFACISVYLAPIVSMGRAYLHRNNQFPVLASFDSRIELEWIVGYNTRREIQDRALEVAFAPVSLPGLSFHEPVPDWSRFKTLLIEVENPDASVLHLGVRIHDIGHGRTYADRFNRTFDLAPFERRVERISLEDVRRGPRNRLMNMTQISDVTLFRNQDQGSQRMRLHGMTLE